VRWSLAGRVGLAWLITLPCAGAFGAVSFYCARLMGYSLGMVVVGVVLALYCLFIFLRSRRDKINARNVNDKWGAHSKAVERSTTNAETPQDRDELVAV